MTILFRDHTTQRSLGEAQADSVPRKGDEVRLQTDEGGWREVVKVMWHLSDGPRDRADRLVTLVYLSCLHEDPA